MHRLFAILLVLPLLQPAPPALPACTPAQHDYYRAVGPDGQQYPTWHPQVDFRQGCVFDHEHGSNPALFLPRSPFKPWSGPGVPLFGYTAQRHGHGEEGHAGFKMYVVDLVGDDGAIVRFMVTHHFGTSNAPKRACTRFHTFDVQAIDPATRELLADVHVMGDFGRARNHKTLAPLTPAECPTQAQDALADGSNGRREMPVAASGATGYEPWAQDTALPNVIGFVTGGAGVNTPHPQTMCSDDTCSASVPLPDPVRGGLPALGAWRTIGFGAGFGFTGTAAGEFWTDPTGRAARGAADHDAVRQYIKPGWRFRLATAANCRPFSPTDYIYDCTGVTWDEAPYRKNPFLTGPN